MIIHILVVASFKNGRYAPFITEQAEALRRVCGCRVDLFGVTGKGLAGYLKALPALERAIRSTGADIVHAHYGLCGLLASLQHLVPVVATYHGSDLNVRGVRALSKLSVARCSFNIFVSPGLVRIARPHGRWSLLPCGVDLCDGQLMPRDEARRLLGLDLQGRYVLFAGAFCNAVKNVELAQSAVALLPGVELLELKGYDRDGVTRLMCAADALLMTSHTEGSPQVVKEAMACGCPVVSVDVGDVRHLLDGVGGCHIAERNAADIAEKLGLVFSRDARTDGRTRVEKLELDNDSVARALMEIYRSVL